MTAPVVATPADPFADLTLEDVLTGRGFADLDASPLQRAVVRAAQGRPVDGTIDEETTKRCFGVSELPAIVPVLVALVCGVRGGKSFIAACALIHSALTADLRKLKPFEVPRGVIVAPTVDAAKATFVQLTGIIQASPVLSRLLDGEPTTDSVTICRPDGRRIELCVVAAHRGGLSVRNRWLTCLVLEEVAQFGAESTGAAVNGEDLLRAGMTRLVPGGQAWLISSPFGPQGLLYDMWKRHFGAPGRTLVVWAGTRDLNPSYPQEAIDALEAEDPDTAAREHYARWTDALTAYLGAAVVDPAIRKEPLMLPLPVGHYAEGAIDPASRGNAFTFALVTVVRTERGLRTVILVAKQWIGSKASPLNLRATLKEIATICKEYGVSVLAQDQWSSDALRELAEQEGLTLYEKTTTAASKFEAFESMKTRLASGLFELPPDPQVRADLLAVRKKITTQGVSVELPKTPDGRHCDYAAVISLASTLAVTEPDESASELPGKPYSDEWLVALRQREEDERYRRISEEFAESEARRARDGESSWAASALEAFGFGDRYR
jgi:hypothetical protein